MSPTVTAGSARALAETRFPHLRNAPTTAISRAGRGLRETDREGTWHRLLRLGAQSAPVACPPPQAQRRAAPGDSEDGGGEGETSQIPAGRWPSLLHPEPARATSLH